MAEMVEQDVASEGRSTRAAVSAKAEISLHQELARRALRSASAATWAPTLEARDLACLMAVIETQLLPTLLRSFRPSDHQPLKSPGLA